MGLYFFVYMVSLSALIQARDPVSSELVSELLQLSGISKSHTTAFDSQTGMATTDSDTDLCLQCRVPRLPVDIQFKTVLLEPAVADFGSYSKTLMLYLTESATITQQHTVKEQECQARQYNKKVKGVATGWRSGVAPNKEEWGKKKLADKWEPVVYTVVERNPKTHIYNIRDAVGQCKVVHRNLLLDVSFLLVHDTLQSQSINDSFDANDLSVCGELDELSSLDKETSQA